MSGGEFEQVATVPAGPGPDGPEYVQVHTGRLRKPASVQEWVAQQQAQLAQHTRLPAGRAVLGLLAEGDDADVRAAGRDLDEHQRKAVLDELRRLEAVARRDYPPAAAMVARIRAGWASRFGTGDRLIPAPVPVVKAAARQRAAAMWQEPPSAAQVAAAWAPGAR
jgi:hypothetical protein